MKDLIEYADFEKLDIRSGIIRECVKLENSDKLYSLSIDVGEDEPRQIVSSLADYYSAQELVGRSCAVLVNLKPAKIRGTLSHGMILCFESDDASRCVLVSSEEPVEPGIPVT